MSWLPPPVALLRQPRGSVADGERERTADADADAVSERQGLLNP